MGNQVMMEGNHTPGSRNPADEIPDSAWPTVLKRVLEKKESLRNVADDSGVSQETIRRFIEAQRPLLEQIYQVATTAPKRRTPRYQRTLSRSATKRISKRSERISSKNMI